MSKLNRSARREMSLHPSRQSTDPVLTPPSHSNNNSTSFDPSTDSLGHAQEIRQLPQPLFQTVFAASSGQSADHPSSSLSLPKSEYTTTMANSASTATYGRSAARKESLSESSAPHEHGDGGGHMVARNRNDIYKNDSNNNIDKGGGDTGVVVVCNASTRRDEPTENTGKDLYESSPWQQRRLLPLSYPSSTAAMSGQLIREVSAAATAASPKTGADFQRISSLTDAQIATTKNNVSTTGMGFWASKRTDSTPSLVTTVVPEVVAVAAATTTTMSPTNSSVVASSPPPPRPVQPLGSSTTATGPSSYVSVGSMAPSVATTITRAEDRTISQESGSGAALLFPQSSALHRQQQQGREVHKPTEEVALASNLNDGDGVRRSSCNSVKVGHCGALSSVFQPSAARGRESATSVDKSAESTAQTSTVTMSSAASRAKDSSVCHVGALSAHAVRYRGRSRRFSTSVGRNVDSYVYLNTNVMSYYEMTPNAAAMANPGPTTVIPTAAGANEIAYQSEAGSDNESSSASPISSSTRGKPTPISSTAAAASEADDHAHAGRGGGSGSRDDSPLNDPTTKHVDTTSHSTTTTSTATAAAAVLAPSEVCYASVPLPPPFSPYGTAGGSGGANTVAAPASTAPVAAGIPSPSQRPRPSFSAVDTGSCTAIGVPMSGRNNICDAQVRWSRPDDATNSRVVRVVNGLLRSPLPDELVGMQFSESSLQSPPSSVELAFGGPVAAGDNAGSVNGGTHARVGGVGNGGAGSSWNAFRTNNPISALLTRGRPRTMNGGIGAPTHRPQQHSYRARSNSVLTNVHEHSMPCDSSAGAALLADSNFRDVRRPSPHGYWGGGSGVSGSSRDNGVGSRENITAYKASPARRKRSGNNNNGADGYVNFQEPLSSSSAETAAFTMNIPAHNTGVAADTPVPPPPTSTLKYRLSIMTNTPGSWNVPQQQRLQQQQELQTVRRSNSALPGGSASASGVLSLNSSAENANGARLPLHNSNAPFSSSTLKPESGGNAEEGVNGGAVAASLSAGVGKQPPVQRGMSSLRDVFTAASFRSMSNNSTGTSTTTSSPAAPHHQRVPSAAAAALMGRLSGTSNGSSFVPPLPPSLPPTFALFGALERLSRFSELVQLHQEHTAVIDSFLSRLTLELHRTTHISTCGASNLGGGGGGASNRNNSEYNKTGTVGEPHDDREFLRWHRILMFLVRNPSELMKVGVEFFSDAVNSWPLHMLYLTCCFHVTACEHGFSALTTALRTGGIVCSGKGLFAALAVAMAGSEEGLIRSTACMYRAAFYTGVLMRKRHQMFESETRLTTNGGFTLLVVNIPIMTLRRLVTRVNEGYDVFAPVKRNETVSSGDTKSSGTTAGRHSNAGLSGTSSGGSPTAPSVQTTPFQLHSVIEVSRVISSRSAVLCGHPLDLLRLDMLLARFADFNGVKIHKEYLPAGGPENSSFFNRPMPHELLGLWRARGVSFPLSSVRLPVYSPVNGDLWADSAVAFDGAGGDIKAASSSLAAQFNSSCRDELFMFLVAEAATAANQDLTYSLRHMKDGSVLLDFSTHAIGIGRLIAWTNKSITVLAAPENRHESSAMPPPRRSPKDTAVLDTMKKLAIINDVLREVSENLEQPPDKLAHPRVDLFTTFAELGLLEVMRGPSEFGGNDFGGGGGGAGAGFDGSGSHDRAAHSALGSSRTLLALGRAFCGDHINGSVAGGGASNNNNSGNPGNGSGGSGGLAVGGRGGGISGSNLAATVASGSRTEGPSSPFSPLPAPAAGRRMKSNVAALVSAKSFTALHPSSSANTGNTSLSTVTNSNAALNGNWNSTSLSIPAVPLASTAAVGLSIPAFDTGNGAAALNVSFNSSPQQQQQLQLLQALPSPPAAPSSGSQNLIGNTAANPGNISLTSGKEVMSEPMLASLNNAVAGCGMSGTLDGGLESTTQQDNTLFGSADPGTLPIATYPECRWPSTLNVFAVAASAGLMAPSPTSVLIRREPRRNNTGAGNPAKTGNATMATATNTGSTSANNTPFEPLSNNAELTDKATSTTNLASLRESDADGQSVSLPLLRPPSLKRAAQQLSNSPSPRIRPHSPESERSPPNHVRSRTHDHGEPPRNFSPQQQIMLVDPRTVTPVQHNAQQQKQQPDSRCGTPTSLNALWYTVSTVSDADSPTRVNAAAAARLLSNTNDVPEGGDVASAGFSFGSQTPSSSQDHQQQQQQRCQPHLQQSASSAASTVVLNHHPLSFPSAHGISNTTTTMCGLRGKQCVLNAEESGASVSGAGGGNDGSCGLASPFQMQQQQLGVLSQSKLSPLAVSERDFVVQRNANYAGIVNVYQVSPLITYFEMQFNCVLCDGAVLFAELLRKASGIAFPPYTLLLCPSVFSLLELWDGFEFEELWKRSVGAVPPSRITSSLSTGLL